MKERMLPYRFDEPLETEQTEINNPPKNTVPDFHFRPRHQNIPTQTTKTNLTPVNIWIVCILMLCSLLGGVVGGWLGSQSNTQVVTASPPQQVGMAGFIPNTGGSNIAGEVYRRVNPSVVKVKITHHRNNEPGIATGSGFVVDQNGLVLTNYHLVKDAETVHLFFYNGEIRAAEIIQVDESNDLALLKTLLPDGIPAAALGDSDTVNVGDPAIAIGSPFGLDQTVTQGIISAIHRDWSDENIGLHSLIQTDASINPGNSGGPLLNEHGDVIGINTLIHSPIGGSVGIGFAVPVNTIKGFLP
jgi:S1-C subfamily serine protease